jgi:tRNA nucleotidyltransferase (CCA-adding enzyme)
MSDIVELYEKIDKILMHDEKPSIFLNDVVEKEIFKQSFPFKMLHDLTKTEQNLQHHPEGNVWNHTMMVVDGAAERKHLSENPKVFMWAALLHDIGKAPTTRMRKGKITSYDHDSVGAKLAEDFLREFTQDEDFIKKVCILVRWHMHILFVVKDLPFADIKSMASQASIDEIALLSICDRLGRGEMTSEKRTEEERNVEIFLKKCREYMKERKESKH